MTSNQIHVVVRVHKSPSARNVPINNLLAATCELTVSNVPINILVAATCEVTVSNVPIKQAERSDVT